MAPFYEEICKDLGWSVDTALLESMKQENAKTLASIEESIKDAEENLGETEIRDLLIKKAEHYSRIGDKVGNNLSMGWSNGSFKCYRDSICLLSVLYTLEWNTL